VCVYVCVCFCVSVCVCVCVCDCVHRLHAPEQGLGGPQGGVPDTSVTTV
jgi:hypothetical protein